MSVYVYYTCVLRTSEILILDPQWLAKIMQEFPWPIHPASV